MLTVNITFYYYQQQKVKTYCTAHVCAKHVVHFFSIKKVGGYVFKIGDLRIVLLKLQPEVLFKQSNECLILSLKLNICECMKRQKQEQGLCG